MFCTLSQNCQHFLQSNVHILKQIIQETQKWHWNFLGQNGFEVMNKYSLNIVLINTQESLGLLE